jgi:TPR repeat protein
LALQFLNNAAKKGDTSADYWLGVLYQNGEGVEKNTDEAEKHYRKAIDKGNLGAKYKLAAMLSETASVPKIKAKQAEKLYAQAKVLFMDYALDPLHNHVNAQYAMYALGEMYETGHGTDQSLRTARYWYESAAKDLSKAMLKMHLLLKDTAEKVIALEWLNKALADPQNADAMVQMASLYLDGFADLVAKDPKKARLLLESAARMNHKEAIAKLMTL